MITKHSVMGRSLVAKGLGFILGALAFFTLPMMDLSNDLYFRLGLWMWCVMLGGIIALMGIVTYHPLFKFKISAWMRGAMIGAFMALLLVLLSYDQVMVFMELEIVKSMGISSPFWMMVDGAILGLILDVCATRYAGEGEMKLN